MASHNILVLCINRKVLLVGYGIKGDLCGRGSGVVLTCTASSSWLHNGPRVGPAEAAAGVCGTS